MKYVVRYEIRTADENVKSLSERDIETDVDLDTPFGREVARVEVLVAGQIVIPSGHHIVVTDIRPA